MIDDLGVFLAGRTFKGFSEGHQMIKLNDLISLSEAKTLFGNFSIDSTKAFEGFKIIRRKKICLDCKNDLMCCDCVIKPKMSCFDCKMQRSCNMCLTLMSQNKTFSSFINLLNKKPANEYHQMLPHYISEHKSNNVILILNLQDKF